MHSPKIIVKIDKKLQFTEKINKPQLILFILNVMRTQVLPPYALISPFYAMYFCRPRPGLFC